ERLAGHIMLRDIGRIGCAEGIRGALRDGAVGDGGWRGGENGLGRRIGARGVTCGGRQQGHPPETEGFTTQSRVEGDMEAYGKWSQRVAMKLPRTRLVADSTARTAPRTGSFSTRQDPSSLGGPSRRLATETITTVASNARIAFTPTSSKTIAP